MPSNETDTAEDSSETGRRRTQTGTCPSRLEPFGGRPARRYRQVHTLPTRIRDSEIRASKHCGALGNALGVPFSQLVDSQAQTVQLIRAGEGPAIASANASYIATLLAPSPPNARRDLYRIVAEPGEPRISTPHARGTTEHVVIGTGRAQVGPTANPIELGPGDYLAYPGDEEHIFRALEPGTTAILVSEHT